jgi:hypothetical protein
VPPPSTLSDLNRPERETLVVELSGEVAALKQMVSEQREEIARLKGLKAALRSNRTDTGARHAGKTGCCTQIGNDWFTWFGTRSSKSRLNFLDLLRAGHTDYVLNDAAFGYMRKHALSAPLIARLMAEPEICFADEAAWLAHLGRLGFTALTVTPDPVRVATESALWGSVQAHKFLCDAVVLSDDAGQFNAGRHALCWIHAERLVHKLDTFTDQHRAVQARVRGRIWTFYANLKAYQLNPIRRRSVALCARFDRIFHRRTGFVTLDRLLARLHANKAELLMVLDRPVDPLRGSTPLHTNGSENDIRCHVTRRKVSGGTRSDRPRLPRCLSQPRQDLRQTRHRGLRLSGQPTQGSGARTHRTARPVRQGEDPARLIRGGAHAFAPITKLRKRGKTPGRNCIFRLA